MNTFDRPKGRRALFVNGLDNKRGLMLSVGRRQMSITAWRVTNLGG